MHRKSLPWFQDFYRPDIPAYPAWEHFHDLNRGTDMHEIVGRGNAPRKIQDALWAVGNVLWLCNVRTGDVQLWQPARDGSLRSDTPLATSADLRTR